MVAYELLLMLDPELADERQDEILARMRELVERGGGTWVGHAPWGRRKLAYEIRHRAEGVYHLVAFDAEPETLAELSRILRITDGVMRHMPTRRIDRGRTPAPPPAPAPAPAAGPAAVGTAEYAAPPASEEEE